MGSNLKALDYSIGVANDRGRMIYVPELLQSLTWEEWKGQLAMRLTATIANERLDSGARIAKLFPDGAQVHLYGGYDAGRPEEVLRGRVFANRSTWNSGARDHEIVVYDPLYYLTMSEADYLVRGGSADVAIRTLLKKFGVPIGTINNPTTHVGNKLYRQKTIAQIVGRILRHARNEGDGRWVLRAIAGKTSTVRRGANDDVFYFEADNISEMDVSRSVENLVTRVKIVGRKKKSSTVLATATSELKDDFGIFQRVVNRSDYDSPRAAERAARHLIETEGRERKTFSMVAPDVPGLRKGHRIHVKAAVANDFYIVRGINHDAPTRSMYVEYEGEEKDEIEIRFRETGLDDWIPPEDKRSRGSQGPRGGVSDTGWQWPLKGAINSPFGDDRGDHIHAGIDIDAAVGTSCFPGKAGTVAFAGVATGYGNVVYLDHGNGFSSRYGHLSQIDVNNGQKISRDFRLGKSGNTGTSTGPHLHFEIRKGGVAVDPMGYLP